MGELDEGKDSDQQLQRSPFAANHRSSFEQHTASFSMTSARQRTALSYLEIFGALSVENHKALFSPKYDHRFAPASVNPPPPKGGPEFAAHLASLRDVLKAFPVTAKDVIEDEQANRVVVWATSETHFHDHVKDDGLTEDEWSYKGEYIFIFNMDETGQQIEKVLEFVDSKGTDRLRGLMKRARRNGNLPDPHTSFS